MKINDLDLLELDNSELIATKFYSAYSSLPFNRGIIFKRIGTQPPLLLADIISKLNKEIYNVTIQNTGKLERIKANVEIHDFIFELLTHKDINKKWRYNDDDFFTEFSEFNSQQTFREIGLDEITHQDFTNRLFGWSLTGSCYGDMNYGEQETKIMIQDFADQLLTDSSETIIVSTQPWGKYLIGWFECFFILRKNDIIIFGQDDYD